MNKPKMILFDFGQTLSDFTGNWTAGTEAVLRAASKNPDNVTAEQVQALADELLADARRGLNMEDPLLEVHNYQFYNYLYEYFHIEFEKTPLEINEIFTAAADKSVPTPGIALFLNFLDRQKIRTGVISNISYPAEILNSWVNRTVPNNRFEIIMASSEYVFRKPKGRIFELALRKVGLPAADVWYCGDNPVCDVDGPAAVGITPVWYKGIRKSSTTKPKVEHLEVQSWEELANLIKSLE